MKHRRSIRVLSLFDGIGTGLCSFFLTVQSTVSSFESINCCRFICLLCFDTVGWASGRAPVLLVLSDEMLNIQNGDTVQHDVIWHFYMRSKLSTAGLIYHVEPRNNNKLMKKLKTKKHVLRRNSPV